jgi:hypothetical protein
VRHDELAPYLGLMRSFESGQISASAFEARYIELFGGDTRLFPDPVFNVLNQLYSDVDVFVNDSSIRGPNDLDQHQLLDCCRRAYLELKNLCKDDSNDFTASS